MTRSDLSLAEARRVALAAQGFTDKPHATVTMRTLERTIARTGVFQIDSVNVLQRAHYLPLYSRAGPYDTALLHRAAERPPRRLVEYWAHVQAYMPVDLWPVMRHRMDSYRTRRHKWWGTVVSEELTRSLLAEITERGAATARDLDDGLPRSKEHWGWNWSSTRRALDYLFTVGEVAVASRTSQFEIRYDLPERVVPAQFLEAPPLEPAAAARELVRRAARSHGVATARDLADYYRMRLQPEPGTSSAGTSSVSTASVSTALAELVEAGELVPVTVEGWRQPAYLHRDARVPRGVSAAALLSPFDPLVWERQRTERLFGFRYRIEIYVPREKRVHGYYVLPFLLGDRLVARVDLKADRVVGVLQVRASYAEAHAPPHTAEALAAELRRLAGWLGLAGIVVDPCGDLADPLQSALEDRAAGATSRH